MPAPPRPDPALVREILRGYTLPPMGDHGVGHWARVLENGQHLAERTGADPVVVAHFAVFHDARRVNEHADPGHGARGSDLARQMRADWLPFLTDDQFALLTHACDRHTDGTTRADVTVQTCWDADRLDLWRVGIEPNPLYLCTRAAKTDDVRAWAYSQSLFRRVPDYVQAEWLAESVSSTAPR
jgi:uncharacterized protein